MNRELLKDLHQVTTPHAKANPLLVLWRWRYEIALPILVLAGFLAMGPVAPAMGAIPLVAILWPTARAQVWGRIRCMATAHRIRVGCIEAYVVNSKGKIPPILWCAPTPIGERVWLWCRAGITVGDLEAAREIIARACWATDIYIHPHPRSPHRVLLEVVRPDRMPERPIPQGASWPERAEAR